MSPALKLGILAVGTLGVGLIAYTVMRKRTIDRVDASPTPVEQPSVIQAKPPVQPTPPAFPPEAIILPEETISSDEVSIDSVICLPEETPLIDADLVDVAVVDEGVLPILPDKFICVYGLEHSCVTNNYVYVNGVHMAITPEDDSQTSQQIADLHRRLTQEIDRIRTETRLIKNRNQKTITVDMMLKTRVTPSFDVLIEFTPKNSTILPDLQAVFVMVDGRGLILPTTQRISAEAWQSDMTTIFAHFLHAVDQSGSMSEQLRDQMFRHLCKHFTLLGEKLYVKTATRQDA